MVGPGVDNAHLAAAEGQLAGDGAADSSGAGHHYVHGGHARN